MKRIAEEYECCCYCGGRAEGRIGDAFMCYQCADEQDLEGSLVLFIPYEQTHYAHIKKNSTARMKKDPGWPWTKKGGLV